VTAETSQHSVYYVAVVRTHGTRYYTKLSFRSIGRREGTRVNGKGQLRVEGIGLNEHKKSRDEVAKKTIVGNLIGGKSS